MPGDDSAPAGHAPPRDPGLQAERTALSWQRTAVSALVVSLASLATASRHGPVALLFAAAAAGTGGAAALVVVPRSVSGFGPRASPWPRLLAVAGATVVLGLAGIVAAAGRVWQ